MVSVMNTNDLELDKPEPVKARVSGVSPDANNKARVSGVSDSVDVEVSGDGVGGGSDGVEKSDPGSGFSVKGVSLVDKGSEDRFRVFEVDEEGEMKPEGSGTKPLKGKKKMEKSVVKVKKPKQPKNEVITGKAIVSTVKSKSVGYGLKLEDQVWGKVKSHPWWPGFIYDEAFAEAPVLRLKKPGMVLVAFFGDGSYGYFDPAELVPFEPNFAEKSRQSRHTAPKVFQKAVDEAIDEACRRRALGLTCRCRNPYNFRAGAVEGYKAVDVVDYEPGAVYSTSMIKEARDKFQPRDMLSFMKQAALMGREDKPAEIDFMQNKATVLAYRRASFEEFDETYAQAFGQTPVRPTREPVESLVPARAHLSGPMVTAEALGKKKKYAKHPKTAEKGKKDAYLFKRRDEPNEVKRQEIGQATSSVQSAHGSSDSAAGEYILQKRKPAKQKIPRKQKEAVHRHKNSSFPSSANGTKVEAPSSSADTPPLKQSPSSDKSEAKDSSRYSGTSGYPGQGTSQVDSATLISEDISKGVDGSVACEGRDGDLAPGTGAGLPGRQAVSESGTKKPKLKKRSAEGLVSEKSASMEKKKKKRKKDLGEEMKSSDPVQISGPAERGVESVGKVAGKASKDEFRVEIRKKDGGSAPSVVTDNFQQIGVVGTESPDLMLSRLLGSLRRVALDPFHAIEGVNPAVVRRFFLRYRSLVYQKSLKMSTPVDIVPVDVGATTSAASDLPLLENVIDSPPPQPRPPKPVRPDDPTKGGMKRGRSDRQEDNSAKKAKRISEAKSAALEKKQVLKNTEANSKRDGKEVGSASRQTKFVKPEPPTKKTPPAPAPRRPEPTVVVMKFPPDTSLPSSNELKARLARFGPLDHSQTRSFWSSSTCRVVYRFRSDAEAAHRHLVGKNTLFGHVSLRCHIKPLEGAQPESETRNSREDAPAEASVEQRGPFAPHMSSSASQLRSCLKKPVPEETAAPAVGGNSGGNGGGSVGSSSGSRVGPRVKFVLGGENSGGGDQTMMMIGNKNLNNSSTSFPEFAGSASLSSPSSFDFNARNFQHHNPPHVPSHFQPNHPHVPSHFQTVPPPVPLHFQNAPRPGNFRYTEAPPSLLPTPRNAHMHNFNHHNMVAQPLPPPPPPPVMQALPPPPTQLLPPPPQREDISGPFLSLLHRNFEKVNEIAQMPGYKPYRPL